MAWKKSKEEYIEGYTEAQVDEILREKAYTDVYLSCLYYLDKSDDFKRLEWKTFPRADYHFFAKYTKIIDGTKVDMVCMLDEHKESEPYREYLLLPSYDAYREDPSFDKKSGFTDGVAVIAAENYNLEALPDIVRLCVIRQYIDAIKTVADLSQIVLTEEEKVNKKKKKSLLQR